MKNKSTRAKYGFALEFPEVPFTLSDVRRITRGRRGYITLYKRAEKAVKDGVLLITGQRVGKGRGRPQTVFTRADVSAVVKVKAKSHASAVLA